MKNLNKKIGVVALSGLVVLGGGLSSSASAYYFSKWKEGVVIGDRWYSVDPRLKSEHESQWESLAQKDVKEEDLSNIINLGKSNIMGYKVLKISKQDNPSSEVDKLIKENHIGEISKNEYGKGVEKYFDDYKKFENHMWNIGMIPGDHKVNVRGVEYDLRF